MADNKKVISIDVQADSFRAFIEIFNKYNETLEHQPEAVKKLEDALNRAGKAGEKLGKTMTPGAKRPGVAGGGGNPKDGLEETSKRSTSALARLADQIKRTDASMLEMFKNADKAKSSGFAKLLVGGIGFEGVAALAGGPAGLVAGLATMAATAAAYKAGQVVLGADHNVSQTAQSAFGADMNYGAYQNANAQLSPFLSNPSAAMQNLAVADFSPQSQGMLGLFGATPDMSKQQQLKQILLSGASDLRAGHNLNTPTQMYERQLLGVSSTQEISLMNQKQSDLVNAFSNMANGKLNGAQDVSGDTVSKDNRTLADWQANMNKAGATFDTALSAANPLVTAFGNAIGGASVDVQAFGKLLSSLTGGNSAAAPSGGSGAGTLSPINAPNAAELKKNIASGMYSATAIHAANLASDKANSLPPGTMDALTAIESSNGKNLISPKGALGPYQFMPEAIAAAKAAGVDLLDTTQGALASGGMMATAYKKYGSWQKAIAAYDMGSGALDADIKAHGNDWLAYAPKETNREVSAFNTQMASSQDGTSSAVHKTLKAIQKQQQKPVNVSLNVTNSTASRVEMSTVAAGWG